MADEQQVVIPPIQFFADGPSEEVRNANLEAVLPSPGFPEAAILIADAITKHAETILLDFTRDAVSVRYQIDGVWHPMPGKDRQAGDYMLATMKKLSNLNFQERRARQEGEFGAKFHNTTTTCNFVSQGVKTGERVAIRLDDGKNKLEKLEDLGMRPRMIESFRELLSQDKGLVLFSTLPGDGSTTLWTSSLNGCDRFMRDFYVVENGAMSEPDVINVEEVPYDRSQGQTAETPLPGLLLREPNVLAFSEPLVDGDMLNTAIDLVLDKDLLVFVRISSRSAVEAMLRTLLLKPNAERLAQSLIGVMYGRLIRTLCENCKQAYQPPVELLGKLGIAPGRVQNFFREFQPPPPEQMVDERGNPIPFVPCMACNGIGYRGRTGIYEFLTVTDEIRNTLTNQPSLATVTEAANNSGHVSLKEEGVVQVAKGVTSITELQRVLKK